MIAIADDAAGPGAADVAAGQIQTPAPSNEQATVTDVVPAAKKKFSKRPSASPAPLPQPASVGAPSAVSGAEQLALAPVAETGPSGIVPAAASAAPGGSALSVAPVAADLATTTSPTALGPGSIESSSGAVADDVAKATAADETCLALAIPEIKQNQPVPAKVADVGFQLTAMPACDLDYSIDGNEMQVLTLKLKGYQEMSFASHASLVQRVPAVQLSKTEYGMRAKNMTGNTGVMVQLAPAYVSNIVSISLTEYPELIINPEVYLAGSDPGLRIKDELRPGFYPYKALCGAGVVFLASVGPAMFHVLQENEAIIAKADVVLAFQTFCQVEACTIESPDPGGCFSAAPRVFPHMKINGPGLIMISSLYPDAKVVPISLDEFPDMYIKHAVFMACSDANIEIFAERIRRGNEKKKKGSMMYCLQGKGVVFLNITGVAKFQKLQAMETIVLTDESLVAYQGSCKVSQEKSTPEDKMFLDRRISGPGLIIVQTLRSEGRKPDRWGAAFKQSTKIVPIPKKPPEDAAMQRTASQTPAKPLPPSQFGAQKPAPNGVVAPKEKIATE